MYGLRSSRGVRGGAVSAGGFGTQVVRCWAIYEEAVGVNTVFVSALAGTVWEYYRLLGTQWQSESDIPPFTLFSISRCLGNSTHETYIQSTSDCLGCHTSAKTTAGADANFSFLLGAAQ